MYPISNTLKNLFKSERHQTANLTVTLDGETAVTIDNSKIVQGSLMIDRRCALENNLALGNCVANELSFRIFNEDGAYDDVDWLGSSIVVRVGVEGSTATVPMGTFYVDSTPKNRTVIDIYALDGMCKFDKAIPQGIKTWWNNKTVANIVSYICSQCGVTLKTNISSYPNSSYKPACPENVTEYTYRQLLMYCCQLMGKCGFMDYDNLLEITFPSAVNVAGVTVFSAEERFNSDYDDEAITISGIVFEDDNTVYVQGTDAYAFDLTGNPLCQDPTTVLGALSGLVGFTYTPFSTTIVPYPHLFPLDPIAYKKADNTTIYGICTNYTFRLNGHCYVASVGETAEEKSRANVNTNLSAKIRQAVAETDIKINSALEEAIENASRLIGQSEGGYVILNDADSDGLPDEILVMDTEDKATATKVWRWNKNGLGYSSNGYNGTYSTAITANGQIVADFISTGSLSADRVKTGIIASADERNTWNLDTGDLKISSGSVKFSCVGQVGDIDPFYILFTQFYANGRNSTHLSADFVEARSSIDSTGYGVSTRLSGSGLSVTEYSNGSVAHTNLVDLPYLEVKGGSESASTGKYRYRIWQNGKIEFWSRRFVSLKFNGTWASPVRNSTITNKTSDDGNNYVRFRFPSGLFPSGQCPMCWTDVTNAVSLNPCWIVHGSQGSQDITDQLWLVTVADSASQTEGAVYIDLYAVSLP